MSTARRGVVNTRFCSYRGGIIDDLIVTHRRSEVPACRERGLAQDADFWGWFKHHLDVRSTLWLAIAEIQSENAMRYHLIIVLGFWRSGHSRPANMALFQMRSS